MDFSNKVFSNINKNMYLYENVKQNMYVQVFPQFFFIQYMVIIIKIYNLGWKIISGITFNKNYDKLKI